MQDLQYDSRTEYNSIRNSIYMRKLEIRLILVYKNNYKLNLFIRERIDMLYKLKKMLGEKMKYNLEGLLKGQLLLQRKN